MIKIPSATARQCIGCLESIGCKKERLNNRRVKQKKNITANTQWNLYRNHNILVKQHSHYVCTNCNDNISTIKKYINISNENINESNFNYIVASFNQIIKEKEKNNNACENDDGIQYVNLNSDQCKSMSGLDHEQIEKIGTESGKKII